MLPFGRLGVPTQIKRDRVTAHRVGDVGRRAQPARGTISATSSPIPSSTIVLFPALTMSTLAG